MQKYLKMLNPELLNDNQIEDIKNKFNLFKHRDIKDIREELIDPIRLDFDITVLKYYKMEHLYEKIKESFLFLFNMRTNM